MGSTWNQQWECWNSIFCLDHMFPVSIFWGSRVSHIFLWLQSKIACPIELHLHLFSLPECLFMSSSAVQTLRVITGCGSHGVGKSKLKQSVCFYPYVPIQSFMLLYILEQSVIHVGLYFRSWFQGKWFMLVYLNDWTMICLLNLEAPDHCVFEGTKTFLNGDSLWFA